MIRNLLALSVLAAGLGGCISYPLSGDDILRTNAQLAQAGRILPSGADLEETGRRANYTVIREDLPAQFGTIALTRLEQGAQRPLVVVCGGSLFRQETRGARTFSALSSLGDVWLLDYPGYGRSHGTGTVQEFEQFRDTVVQRIQQAYQDGRTGKLIFVGHSFGGGICARMASDVGLPSSLVLVSAFRDYESVVRARAGGFGWLIRPRIGADLPNYDIVDALETYSGTIVVAAATGDTTVPFATSAALYRDLKGGSSIVTFIDLVGPDHTAILEAPELVTQVRTALSLE